MSNISVRCRDCVKQVLVHSSCLSSFWNHCSLNFPTIFALCIWREVWWFVQLSNRRNQGSKQLLLEKLRQPCLPMSFASKGAWCQIQATLTVGLRRSDSRFQVFCWYIVYAHFLHAFYVWLSCCAHVVSQVDEMGGWDRKHLECCWDMIWSVRLECWQTTDILGMNLCRIDPRFRYVLSVWCVVGTKEILTKVQCR